MIQFDQEICNNLETALAREWLETNGLGGFASSTIIGLNTRRYHGLLTAATKPPVGRLVLLSKLEETLIIDGRRFELSANQHPGVVHPQGYRHLNQFRLDPFPVFTYEIEGIEIEKSVFMIHGENSTIIQYGLRTTNHEPRTTNHEPRFPRAAPAHCLPRLSQHDARKRSAQSLCPPGNRIGHGFSSRRIARSALCPRC